MNLERIKKAAGQRVQLRPPAIPLDSEGRGLAPVDDVWLIETASDENVRVLNTRTNHFYPLGKDHIHHYVSNPDATRRTGVPHGYFVLNVQLFIQGDAISVTPTPRPGQPVPPNASPTVDAAVDLNYPLDSGLQRELEAQGCQIAWTRESLVRRRTTLEGWSVVRVRDASGQYVGFRVRSPSEDLVLLKRPA